MRKKILAYPFFFVLLHLEMIHPDTIQRIKEAAHIEEVVSRFLSLRKRGTNYVACCPFHQEKTGSFNVNPARNIYKCFGCGKSGDSISFLMEHDHKTYPEALRYLADMYGIEVEEEEVSDEVRARQHQRDSLLKCTSFAQQCFAEHIADAEAYLRSHGVTDEIVRTFGLGCKSADNFADYARSQGYDPEVIASTGLADADQHDLLPSGLIFPIHSKDGHPISFVAKQLQPPSQPGIKTWTFLPPSPIFDYGRALFGFFQAKKHIGQRDKCYLVSNLEVVLSMHQAGIANTVAPCSAILTADQIKDIRRFTHNITLVCGHQVAQRFDASALFAAGMHLRLVVFPQGETPDTYAQAHGATALQTFLDDNEQNFILYRTDSLIAQRLDLDSTVAPIGQLLAQLADTLERDAYIPLLAERLGISEQHLRQRLRQSGL